MKNKITIREISKKLGKEIIVKNHYSHKWTMCRYALGIFYETENQHSFFDEKEEKLAGVAIYGYPVGRLATTSISDELKSKFSTICFLNFYFFYLYNIIISILWIW